jgi:hypothetical protein
MLWGEISLILFGTIVQICKSIICPEIVSVFNEALVMYRVSRVFLSRHICGQPLLYKGKTTWAMIC